MHRFFESTRPLVLAHRGGAGLAPENTLAAFDNGLSLGADGLELDVHLSRDGIVVVHHDASLDRTTDRSGPIDHLTADELARVDAAYRFRVDGQHAFRGLGIGVPALDAVLARYRDCRLVIEMKVNRPEMARAVVACIRARGALDRVCVGAYRTAVLDDVRRLEPALATSASKEEVRWALYRSWCRWPASHVAYQGFQIPETHGLTRVVSRRFIADAHRAGLGVQIWTVNQAADAARLIAWGADAVITDRPDLIVPVVAA